MANIILREQPDAAPARRRPASGELSYTPFARASQAPAWDVGD